MFRVLAFALVALCLHPQEAWELELETPRPVDDDLPERLADLTGLACAECHVAIAEEWATTLHALAWEDPRYRKALRGKRKQERCHGCHVPQPLHTAEVFGRKPPPRAEDAARHLGISCESCHSGPDGEILGPWGAPTDAHASVRSEHFVGTGSNALCAACHGTNIGPVLGVAKDFQSARLAERGMSCVGCHMAPVERPVAVAADGAPLPARPGRSHLLQTPRDPAFLAQAFAIEARRELETVVVTIRNRAGHRVPGLQGREIRLTATLPDGESAAELVIDHRAYLPVEGARELRLDGTAASVRVAGLHTGPHLDRPVRFLEREVPVRE